MNHCSLFVPAVLSLAFLPGASHAENAILSSLNKQVSNTRTISDKELENIRGASLIIGQPLPSVTQGSKTFQISWKGFGSKTDYRQYRYFGDSYSPHENQKYNHGGTTHTVAGDTWMADLSGNPNQWSQANSIAIERHLQILDEITLKPTNQAVRETAWNRPITTFRW